MFRLKFHGIRSASPQKKREVDDATINQVASISNSFYDLKQQLSQIAGQLNQLDNNLDNIMFSMDSNDSYYGTAEDLANQISMVADTLNSLGV